jgi:hypothetical protein
MNIQELIKYKYLTYLNLFIKFIKLKLMKDNIKIRLVLKINYLIKMSKNIIIQTKLDILMNQYKVL